MEKLYYENPYIKDFTAEIINVMEKDNKYHVELDKTYFYPGDGSQPSDSGYISTSPVIHVYEEDDKIYHVVEIKPLKIHRVKCSIDWTKKYYYMQQYLGQRIISACFSQLFNAITVNFKLEEDYSYVDINKALGKDDIKKAEDMANKIILDNINIETLYPNRAELKKLSIKKTPQKSCEKIRLIKIGDIDIIPCNGLYPNSTIEVQIIKVSNCEKYGNNTRIKFISGSKAVFDYFSKYELVEKISSILSCNDNNLLDKVQMLSGELNKALSEKSSLKAEVAQYEVENMLNSSETIRTIRVLKSVYDNADLKYINLLASKLVSFPNVIVLFGIKSADKSQLLFMCSKDLNIISMNSLLKDAITLIDGKGGGSDSSAQGGGKNNNNLDSSIQYAYTKVKDCIISDSNN